ncbi:MAG: fused MFS/spermidine synthase [Chloroflexi bacterium]|nr:fused MFS/spermidine synthase [Chloroflexota bacterium]
MDGVWTEPERSVELVEDGGRLALAIDGVVQSIAVAGGATGGYWAAMLPDRPPRDALLLGLGGGTLVHLLIGTFGALPIVGVEDDPRVVELGRAHFGLDLANLSIEQADAFAYVASCTRRFDLVCVDLFRGGAIPRRVVAPAFLADVARLLRPGGTAVFNLARDRQAGNHLGRLRAHFMVGKRVLVGFNLVVHCHAPTAGERGVSPRRRHGRRVGGRWRARRRAG